jgi:hypothetical protein
MNIITGQQQQLPIQQIEELGVSSSTSSSSPWWDNDIITQPTDERMLEAQGRHQKEIIESFLAEETERLLPTTTQQYLQQEYEVQDDDTVDIEELEAEGACYTPLECVQWYCDMGFLEKP